MLIQAIRTVAAGGLNLEPSLAEPHVVGRYLRRFAAGTVLHGTALNEREIVQYA